MLLLFPYRFCSYPRNAMAANKSNKNEVRIQKEIGAEEWEQTACEEEKEFYTQLLA